MMKNPENKALMQRSFVIAAFGDRRTQVQRLVKNIRSYVDYPIHIITTTDSNIGSFEKSPGINIKSVPRIWAKGTYREGIRNSNYYKVKFAIDHHYDSLCMLDDDMFIVDKNFVDGFVIAERFGVALPINPRIYVGFNAMGSDSTIKDMEYCSNTAGYAPACNFSPFFVYPHAGLVCNFLHELEYQLRNKVCRGTLAIWKASWKSHITPVYLPEQWCVCGSSAEWIKNYTKILRGQTVNIPPMMLHLGHSEVQKVFKDIIK